MADGTEANPLHGQKLGIFWDWFNDAVPEVVETCKAAVSNLCAKGAEVRDVLKICPSEKQ